MNFNAHTIELKDGYRTRGEGMLLADTPFMKAIREAIERHVPVRVPGHSWNAVDLACHEGGFSAELARMGFDTLGIDARKENLFKANFVKFHTRLRNLHFVLDDVRNLERYGLFDVVLCTGILYHLDYPAGFLEMLCKQTRHVLILYTFYAPGYDLLYDIGSWYNRLRKKMGMQIPPIFERYARIGITEQEIRDAPAYLSHYKGSKLGPLTRHEGYAGRWYREWDSGSTTEQIEAKARMAYSNSRSFWFTREELARALQDAGFSEVYESKAPLGDFHSRYPSSFFGSRLMIAVNNTAG
jgi:hypothetical protein